MTPALIVPGSVILFGSVFLIAVVLPWATISERPSEIFRPRTALEEEGRRAYIQNGCGYCHTQFVRNIDWDLGAERVAHSGDYVQEQPHLLCTERTGPDLSQEGGEHPDDWHLAHFTNPRYTRPESIMPSWEFLGEERIKALIAYKQSLGYRMADYRVQRQQVWKQETVRAYESGPDANVAWLHAMIPEPWPRPPTPYPPSGAGLQRGHRIYKGFCIGCQGPIGDGMGPAQPYLY